MFPHTELGPTLSSRVLRYENLMCMSLGPLTSRCLMNLGVKIPSCILVLFNIIILLCLILLCASRGCTCTQLRIGLLFLIIFSYKRNGILPMLKRNLGVKTAPQRWQENGPDGHFDVVFTFEEKVFDMVVEG